MGIQVNHWWFLPLAPVISGLSSMAPLLLSWYYIPMCPILSLLVLIMPSWAFNPTEQNSIGGVLLFPATFFVTSNVYLMESSFGWLYWLGLDLYTGIETYKYKLAALFFEFWCLLSIMILSTFTWSYLHSSRFLLSLIYVPIYYGYFYKIPGSE